MPDVSNGFRLNMTYQGNNVLINKPSEAGINTATSTTTDNVLDLSNKANLVAELTTQDLSSVKAIKLGSKYIMAPDPETLRGLVDQLKQVCLDDNGTLRRDLIRVVLERKEHKATEGREAYTQVSLNVIGPEPNDGYKDTHDYIKDTHLLQEKDTLTNLARQYYGDENLERNIQLLANFNKLSDPNKLQAGQPLYIPEMDVLLLYKTPVQNQLPPQDNQGGGTAPVTGPGGGAVTPPVQTTPPVTPPTPDTGPPVTTPTTPANPATETYSGPMTAQGLMDFIGTEGADYLITAEGARNRAYKDSVGKWTIGVGHLIRLPAERHLLNKTLTQAEMRQLLQQDMAAHIQPLLDHIKPEVLRNLNRNQITALASLAFNIGPGGIVNGQRRGFKYSPVVAALNRGGDFNANLRAAATAMDRHSYAGGRRNGGLVNRREAERLLMLGPDIRAGSVPVYDARALRRLATEHNITR